MYLHGCMCKVAGNCDVYLCWFVLFYLLFCFLFLVSYACIASYLFDCFLSMHISIHAYNHC